MRHALTALRIHLEAQPWSPAHGALIHEVRNCLQVLHVPEGLTDQEIEALLERTRDAFDQWLKIRRPS